MARKKNRKVAADKEKILEEKYRGIMEGRREMKITASPTAKEAAKTKAAQKNPSSCVRKQVSASQQGRSWACSSRSVCKGLSHTYGVVPGWETPSTALWEVAN